MGVVWIFSSRKSYQFLHDTLSSVKLFRPNTLRGTAKAGCTSIVLTSNRASKMVYSQPSAVNITSYKESLNQSDCWKLFFSSEIKLNLRVLESLL